MDSRRFLSYQWRLFFPIVGMMWLLIIVLVIYQYRREVTYRTESIHKELSLINNRIIDAYEQDISLIPFMNFLSRYYENSTLEDMSVTVFDRHGNLIYSIGTPMVKSPVSGRRLLNHETIEDRIDESDDDDQGLRTGDKGMFYYAARKSVDGQIYVHTAMPYNLSIADAISAEPDFWIIMIALAVLVTVVTYITTSYLSRNIRLLKQFATRAATNSTSIDIEKFPHDELGDISRQIVRLWREKDEAIRESNKEHEIALHAVEEKSRIKRQLTNNINHELKTPVGVIRGYLDSLASTPDLDEGTRNKFIARARENVERLCNLLSDVSSMTRLEEGASKIPTEEVNFHDLCYSIRNDVTTTGLIGDMKFMFDMPLDCNVKGNTGLLTSVVENFVKNAVKYSHGTELGIRMLTESPRYYTFSFYDNGAGVGEEHIPHLFERFYRIDVGRSRKAGGTGLGLPIVKNTIEALGGTISVRNRSTGGLEFLFTLEKWRPQHTL